MLIKTIKTHEFLKNIICSEVTKNIIYILITIFVAVDAYILLFIGYGTTYIDDVSCIMYIILIVLQVVRSFLRFLISEENIE